MKKESRKDGCPGQSLDGGQGSDMTPEAFEAACRRAVSERDDVYVPEYVTRLDPESGLVVAIWGIEHVGLCANADDIKRNRGISELAAAQKAKEIREMPIIINARIPVKLSVVGKHPKQTKTRIIRGRTGWIC